jgi:hypothetical protein
MPPRGPSLEAAAQWAAARARGVALRAPAAAQAPAALAARQSPGSTLAEDPYSPHVIRLADAAGQLRTPPEHFTVIIGPDARGWSRAAGMIDRQQSQP